LGLTDASYVAGGDVEVAGIKEGALRVYSGQRLFPLTFQMPESGLALEERRWHASRKGGNVTLGSIAASELEVYTCGELSAALSCFSIGAAAVNEPSVQLR